MSERSVGDFTGESEIEALAAADAAVVGGRDAELAQLIMEQLAGENSWLRDRTLRRLVRLSHPEALIPHFSRALHDGANADRRNAGRSALAALSHPDTPVSELTVAALADLLRTSSDVDARLMAAVTLGESGNARGRAPLEAALRDREPNVAAGAAEALGLLGDQRAVPALIDALESGDYWTKIATVLALGRLGDARALPALSTTLASPATGMAGAEAIGQIGDISGVDLLRPALSRSALTRAGALSAIGRIYGRNPRSSVPDWLRDEAALDERELERDFARDHSAESARLLGIAASEGAIRTLFDALETPDLHAVASAGLELLPPDAVHHFALGRLDSSSPDAQTILLDILPPLREPDAIRRVVECLGSTDPEIRAAAAHALGRSDSSLVAAALAQALQRPDLRAGIAQAYGRLRIEACEPLFDLLSDSAVEVRAAAAAAVGRCGPSGTSTILAAFSVEADPGVRQALVSALGEVGGDEVVPALSGALREPEPALRFAAARALGRLGSGFGLEPLLEALRDPSPEVRIAALRALGELGDARAARVIEGHLDDQSREIRRTAARALDDLGGAGATDRLTAALDDPDREVRLTAVETLTRIGGAAVLRALEARVDRETDPLVRNAITRVVVDLHDAHDVSTA